MCEREGKVPEEAKAINGHLKLPDVHSCVFDIYGAAGGKQSSGVDHHGRIYKRVWICAYSYDR